MSIRLVCDVCDERDFLLDSASDLADHGIPEGWTEELFGHKCPECNERDAEHEMSDSRGEKGEDVFVDMMKEAIKTIKGSKKEE